MRQIGKLSLWGLIGALSLAGLPSCEEARPMDEATVVVGDTCPRLDVVDLLGVERTFPVTGRPSLLFLYTSTCPDCQRQFPTVEELYRRYGDRVEFLGLARGEDEATARAFLESKGYSLPVAADTSGALFALFAPQGVPRIYILRNDRVVYAYNEYSTLGLEDGISLIEGLLPFFE